MTAPKPYIGLRPFERDDVAYFFGRERAVQNLLLRLRDQRLVAVIGPSGVGKSSLVRAGLIPALEGGMLDWDAPTHWTTVKMSPGEAPIENLAKALIASRWGEAFGGTLEDRADRLTAMLRSGASALAVALGETVPPDEGRLLLLVDQFEELFRYQNVGEEDERRRARADARSFINLITAATHAAADGQDGPLLHIVLTMRADFLGDCADIPDLADCMNRCLYVVSRMTDEEMMDAISLPAKAAGGSVERELALDLLEQFQGERDALPILQHALMRCWEEEESSSPRHLTSENYLNTFWFQPPLAVHLNDIFNDMQEDDQEIAQAIFRRLTKFDEAGRQQRNPARLSDLAQAADADIDDVMFVIDEFRRANRDMLTLSQSENDDPIVDISHEAIMRHWPRLKEWMRDERDMATSYKKLIEISEQRASLAGDDLKKLTDWRAAHAPHQGWANRYPGEFDRAMAFLKDCEEKTKREDLLKSIKDGDFRTALETVRGNVRLGSTEINEQPKYKPHYLALAPDAIDTLAGAIASPSQITGQQRADPAGRDALEEQSFILSDAALNDAFPDDGQIKPKTLGGLAVAHYAAAGGSVQVLQRLADLGETFEQFTDNNSSVFDLAVFAGRAEAARWLHNKINDQAKTVEHRDHDGWTPLHWAIVEGHYGLTKWLLGLGANPAAANTEGDTAVHWAARLGQVEILDLFAGSPPELINGVNGEGHTPLHAALSEWDESIEPKSRLATIRWLLEHGAKADEIVESSNTGCLLMAIENDELDPVLTDVAELLVKHGAEIEIENDDGEDAITQSVRAKRIGALETLLDLFDRHRRTASDALRLRWLRSAVQSGSVEAVHALASRGLDASVTDSEGRSALHWAAIGARHPQLLNRLVDFGLDLNQRDHNGLTALDVAMIADAEWAVLILVQKNAAKSRWIRKVEDASVAFPLRFLNKGEIAELLRSQMQDADAVNWPLMPMLDGKWDPLNAAEAAQTLATFLAAPPARLQDRRAEARPDVVTNGDRSLAIRLGDRIQAMRKRKISFYPDATIFEALIAAKPPHAAAGCLAYVATEKGSMLINGNMDDIYRFNDLVSVKLLQVQHASEYLQFICAAIQSELGAFTLLTEVGRVAFAPGAASSEALAWVERVAAPPAFLSDVPDPKDKSWRAKGSLRYGKRLFEGDFKIDQGGMVEISGANGTELPLLNEGFYHGMRIQEKA